MYDIAFHSFRTCNVYVQGHLYTETRVTTSISNKAHRNKSKQNSMIALEVQANEGSDTHCSRNSNIKDN